MPQLTDNEMDQAKEAFQAAATAAKEAKEWAEKICYMGSGFSTNVPASISGMCNASDTYRSNALAAVSNIDSLKKRRDPRDMIND